MEKIVDFVQRNSGLHFKLALVEAALYRDTASRIIVQPRILTCRKGIPQAVQIYENVMASLEELRSELGDDLECWENNAGRQRIGFRRPTRLPFAPNDSSPDEFGEAVSWMRDRLDRLVSTLHPRLQRMIAADN